MKYLWMLLSLLGLGACQTTGSGPADRQLAVVSVTEQGNTQEILGYIKGSQLAGRNRPLAFYSNENRKVCEGVYHIMQGSQKGLLDLSCFNGRFTGSGEFFINGHRSGRTYGTATIKSETSDFRLVYGLSYAQYNQYQAKLSQ